MKFPSLKVLKYEIKEKTHISEIIKTILMKCNIQSTQLFKIFPNNLVLLNKEELKHYYPNKIDEDNIIEWLTSELGLDSIENRMERVGVKVYVCTKDKATIKIELDMFSVDT
jgi:hypothetical protein